MKTLLITISEKGGRYSHCGKEYRITEDDSMMRNSKQLLKRVPFLKEGWSDSNSR